MESDLQQQQGLFANYQLQQQHNQPNNNSGLSRFRSAPSSYFKNLLDSCEEFLNRPSSPETELIFAGLMSSSASGGGGEGGGGGGGNVNLFGSMKTEAEVLQQEQSNFSPAASSQNFYQASSQLQNQSMDYKAVGSMVMDRSASMKTGNNSSSNLIRQSSSPAGLFSNKNIDGYSTSRSIDVSCGTAGESSFSPASRFSNRMNFSSRPPPSSSGKMSLITEKGKKSMDISSPEGGDFGEGHGNDYMTGFPVGSWDDPLGHSDNFTGMEEDEKGFLGLNASETEEGKGRVPGLLAHHLSLPSKSSTDIEKFLQLQESVPCKIRAKRGCATHPRSIAERVRRTKISERIRRLQDLVPNMDKQTNTADMLDLAVEYIKDLQEQVKMLSDDRAKCSCLSKQML